MTNRLDQVIDWIRKNVNRRGAKLCNCRYGKARQVSAASEPPTAAPLATARRGCFYRIAYALGIAERLGILPALPGRKSAMIYSAAYLV
jgi:hypothetical protein